MAWNKYYFHFVTTPKKSKDLADILLSKFRIWDNTNQLKKYHYITQINLKPFLQAFIMTTF